MYVPDDQMFAIDRWTGCPVVFGSIVKMACIFMTNSSACKKVLRCGVKPYGQPVEIRFVAMKKCLVRLSF